jgi:hypothetical protein
VGIKVTARRGAFPTIAHANHEIWSVAAPGGKAYLGPMDNASSPSSLSTPSRFWRDTLHAMHPSLRVRYYLWFSMVEAMDRSFDSNLDLWRNANAAAMQNYRALLR